MVLRYCWYIFFPLLAIQSLIFTLEAAEGCTSAIPWHTDYVAALKEARQQDKALVLFFTGTGWCTYCDKLEREILDQPAFAKSTNDHFIFVKLDFPKGGAQNLRSQFRQQNEQLRAKHHVSGFPTLLVMDSSEQLLGRSGYRQLAPDHYARQLLAMLTPLERGSQLEAEQLLFSSSSSPEVNPTVCETCAPLGLTSDDFRGAYLKARSREDSYEARKLVERGLEKDKDNFFHYEQYRLYVEEGNINSAEGIKLRDWLLHNSGKSPSSAAYAVAVIEHEALQELRKRPRYGHEDAAYPDAAYPLEAYLVHYGKEDTDNNWRVHIALAEWFSEQGKPTEALDHARQALQQVPSDHRASVRKAVEQIRTSQERLAGRGAGPGYTT